MPFIVNTHAIEAGQEVILQWRPTNTKRKNNDAAGTCALDQILQQEEEKCPAPLSFWLQSCFGLISIVSGPAEGDECCGSIIDFRNETSPTGAFQRISTGPAFYVAKGFPLSRDICPPNRISDFELTLQEEKTLDLELAWTAPGGDYDFDRGDYTIVKEIE